MVSSEWTYVQALFGYGPPPTTGFSHCNTNSSFWIFGGLALNVYGITLSLDFIYNINIYCHLDPDLTSSLTQELWQYSYASNSWQLFTNQAAANPGALVDALMWAVEDDSASVWVYGGASGYTEATAPMFYRFFPSTSSWEVVNVTEGDFLRYSSGI